MSETCVFCKIVAREVPATLVLENDDFMAFHDVQPKADVHVLVIPRAHHANLDEFVRAGGDSAAMLSFVRQAAATCDIGGRYRPITNVGEDAGQVVPHLHWHVLAGRGLPGFGP